MTDADGDVDGGDGASVKKIPELDTLLHDGSTAWAGLVRRGGGTLVLAALLTASPFNYLLPVHRPSMRKGFKLE